MAQQSGQTEPKKPAAGTVDRAMAREAVYVLTNDYLAVGVHDSKAAGTGGDKPAGGTRSDPTRPVGGASTSNQPSSQSFRTFILKRNGTTAHQ